jgi:hypothetical protein
MRRFLFFAKISIKKSRSKQPNPSRTTEDRRRAILLLFVNTATAWAVFGTDASEFPLVRQSASQSPQSKIENRKSKIGAPALL